MKTAILSDIHGNLQALLVALKDADERGCDRVICLGDLVDGGHESLRVIAEIQQRNIPCVQGNHDAIPNEELPKEAMAFLRSLPEHMEEGDRLYTHISPRDAGRKIKNTVEAWNVFDETTHRLIFIGHVHVPLVFGERSDSPIEARACPIKQNRLLGFDPHDRYIICVGAVGYTRDRHSLIRYVIHDEEADSIVIRAIPGPLLDL